MFVRVEGSAWGVKFDTKRIQGKQNKHLEDDSEKGTDKNTQKWQDEAQKKAFNLTSVFSDALALVGWEVGGRGPPFRRAPARPGVP